MKNAMNFRPVGLMLLFCLIPLWAFAQSVMVKGVVKDTSGEAIIGASVLEKGTTNGTITDFDGNFALNVSKNAVLVEGAEKVITFQFSQIGLKIKNSPSPLLWIWRVFLIWRD